MESFLAFKVSDLVVGVGAIVVLLGLSHIALGSFLGLLLWKREGVAGAQKELGAALR
jgi:hypothetical protein